MKKKILIADDSKSYTHTMQRILAIKNNYEIEIANDGLEAKQKICDFNPHLIILDIMMPDVNGLEICLYIRNELKNNEMKILIISASVKEADITQSMQAGADDYLTKPFDNKTFEQKIEDLLGTKNQ